MPARLIEIAELQPTDTLRVEVINYYSALSNDEIKAKHGVPQVWQTNRGMLISDGNNRTGIYAKRGAKLIEVDFQDGINNILDCFSEYLEEIVSRAEDLRKQGIFSPHDLWQA